MFQCQVIVVLRLEEVHPSHHLVEHRLVWQRQLQQLHRVNSPVGFFSEEILHFFQDFGILDIPPTITTSSISPAFSPASLSAF